MRSLTQSRGIREGTPEQVTSQMGRNLPALACSGRVFRKQEGQHVQRSWGRKRTWGL